MNKILGSSKDLENKDPADKASAKLNVSGFKTSSNLPEPKGLILPGSTDNHEPLIEEGLELPSLQQSVSASSLTGGTSDLFGDEDDDLRLYRAACQYVDQFMRNVDAFDIQKVATFANQIIRQSQSGNGLLRLATRPEYIEPFLGAHSVNIAILASMLAETLRFDERQRLRTTVAALAHDIGMTGLTSEVLHNERDLQEDEVLQLQNHPVVGAAIIQERLGPEYEWLATAIRQEHERAQGQGYPSHLTVGQIDVNAQIIGMLDIYEAIIHPRRQRAAYPPSKAIKQIIETRSQLFATPMVKALVEAVSMYPVDTFVQLNNGQIGQVVTTDRKNPLRPVVEIRFDHNHRPIPQPKLINLRDNVVLSIVKALDETEIPTVPAT